MPEFWDVYRTVASCDSHRVVLRWGVAQAPWFIQLRECLLYANTFWSLKIQQWKKIKTTCYHRSYSTWGREAKQVENTHHRVLAVWRKVKQGSKDNGSVQVAGSSKGLNCTDNWVCVVPGGRNPSMVSGKYGVMVAVFPWNKETISWWWHNVSLLCC